MYHHQETSFAAHGSAGHGRVAGAAVAGFDGARRRRRCARRRRRRRRVWPASKWCTARRAARWRHRTSITGRPKRKAAISNSAQTLEPLEPFRDYLTIVSDTDLHPATRLVAGRRRRRPFPLERRVPHRRAPQDDRRLGLFRAALRSTRCTRSSSARTRRCRRIQLCIEMVDASGACDYGYACVYADTISWASPTTAAAHDARSAHGVRESVRRRRHAGGAAGAAAR